MTAHALAADRPTRLGYLIATGLAAAAMAAVGAADLLRVPAVIDGLIHLGYPAYFATILGVWKLAGAVAIVAPGMPRIKEWAYAGMFFTLTGAAVSHLVMRELSHALVPLALLAVVLASWNLRSVDSP